MARRHVWRLQVSGKWGGTRTLHVVASSDSAARKAARSHMRNDESVWSCRSTGLTPSEHEAKGERLS